MSPTRRERLRVGWIGTCWCRRAAQGPAPEPLLQYSENRLPVALNARPEVAAAAQGAVLEMWAPSVDSRTTACPFGVGETPPWSQERPSEILLDGALASAVNLLAVTRKP